jgi:hypothetical protein
VLGCRLSEAWWFRLRTRFGPDDGRDKFLRNVSRFPRGHMVLYRGFILLSRRAFYAHTTPTRVKFIPYELVVFHCPLFAVADLQTALL